MRIDENRRGDLEAVLKDEVIITPVGHPSSAPSELEHGVSPQPPPAESHCGVV